ncbi:MAG: hypothetical protein JNM98_16455 [Rhodocyclaceae bacterium]|nr:hypothetical protein [Rhodocyclaceae bacterium]
MLALMLPLQALAGASICAHWQHAHGQDAAGTQAHAMSVHCDQQEPAQASKGNTTKSACDHCGYCQLGHGAPLPAQLVNFGADAHFELATGEPRSPPGHIPDLPLRPPRRA